jgi:hypothetical protein
MTPNLAVLQFESPHWHMPRLWLPLFLLWIPAILLSPLIFLVIVGVSVAIRINPFRAIALVWGIACGLPGTDVRVTADGMHIVVRIL